MIYLFKMKSSINGFILDGRSVVNTLCLFTPISSNHSCKMVFNNFSWFCGLGFSSNINTSNWSNLLFLSKGFNKRAFGLSRNTSGDI